MSYLRIIWSYPDSGDYVDYIPMDVFRTMGGEMVSHAVVGPKNRTSFARCHVTLQAKKAILDYSCTKELRDYNAPRDFLFGTITVTFSDTKRTKPVTARWYDRGKKNDDGDVPAILVVKDIPHPKGDLGKTADRLKRLITVRQRSTRFREDVRDAFLNRCCISNCTAEPALDAAHVAPHGKHGPDDRSNGLLLRSDLHKLFDSGGMAIDPVRLTAHFAKDVLKSPEYKDLENAKVRLPSHGWLSETAEDALNVRWDMFNGGRKRKTA